MERPLDKIYWVKFGHKGPDFGFGPFSTVKSRKFLILPKSNFFWSEWLANWFLGSLKLNFLYETLKLAKKGHFFGFFPILVNFDRFWKRQNLGGISGPKGRFSSEFWKETSKSLSGWAELNPNCSELPRKKSLLFSTILNLVRLVP